MMEYNYYPVQPGQPPPPLPSMMNSMPDSSPMGGQVMTSVGPTMMQPSPHQNYHQLPQHPPISHSASPHPSSTPHTQQPPPRPSTGPSPLHHQSPIHMNPPPPMHHHPGPPPPQHGPPQHGPPPQHPASIPGRGPPPPGPMPLNPPPPGYIISPHGPPSMHHQHQGGAPPAPQAVERGSPFYQHIPQTEFRIIELNKRLQKRPLISRPPGTLPTHDYDESVWWRSFACDFFSDQATLSLRFPGPTEYTIGRTLIPRFFKSYFDGGVTDFAIKLRNARETTHHPGFITLDCDQTHITTKNIFRQSSPNSQLSVLVHTEGHLEVDFVSNGFDNFLIKSWRFYANLCNEYVDRTTVGMANSYLVEPVTRFGLTKNTFAFLKMCMIMEPMQDLMLQHKNSNMDPRSCLKRLLLERYNHKTETAPGKRKRQRKEKNATGGTNRRNKANMNGPNTIVDNQINMGNNMMQPGDLPLASQDVLVVGEPSMLGADFGDANERRITRLENNQFDPSTSMEQLEEEPNPGHEPPATLNNSNKDISPPPNNGNMNNNNNSVTHDNNSSDDLVISCEMRPNLRNPEEF